MGISAHRVVRSGESSAGTLEEHRALLQRVLSSRQFEKSPRIRQLLVYVCERTSRDSLAQIHEQEIGHAVFGRSADYDTSQDNIVRVTASQARKKLEQYFAGEGQSERVILEIPKGQYLPVFRERGAQPFADMAPELKAQEKPPSPGRSIWVLSICVALLAVTAAWLAIELRNQRLKTRAELETHPTVNALWSQLIPGSGRTDIIVSDSSLSLFQELRDRQLTLSEYLRPDWTRAVELASNPELQAFAQQAAQRRFTSQANVTIAYRIAQLAGRDQSRISIFSAPRVQHSSDEIR